MTAALLLTAAAVTVWAVWFRSDEASDGSATATSVRQVVAVQSATMGTRVSAEGTVAAAQTEDLSFTSAGTVKTVDVAAGDKVTAGQVLATIDSSELRPR
ncbi:MAG: biotin/lipoyl-binding protein [Microthrixaceae bacterium]